MRRFLGVLGIWLMTFPAWGQINNPGVTGPPVSTAGDLATYLDTTGRILADPGFGTTAGRITNVNTPVNPTDVANKAYVDAIAAGLTFVSGGPTLVATTANLTATYANGASGVGATLTNSGTQAALVIDGVSLATTQRVLVKDQTTQAQNGIYTVTTVGNGSTNWVLTRATDFDQPIAGEVAQGALVAVSSGTVNAGTIWVETGAGPFTIGTTPIIWSRFGAGAVGCSQLPALTGDVTSTGCATVVGKVDGVTYPSGPSLNTVPVVTNAAAGGTVTYEAVPNAALANSSITVNTVSCTLGGSCTITASPGALTSAHLFVGNASNVATDTAVSGDLTLSNTGAFTLNTVATAGTQAGITWNVKGLVTSGGPGTTNLGTGDGQQYVPNNGTTATVLHKLVILAAGTYTATVATTGSTTNVIGICDANCTTAGNATIANYAGTAQCIFDGATTAGDWVVASTTVAGDCHDGGATVPTTVQVLGQVESTNGGAGTYNVDLNPVGVMSALNAKTSPGGSSGQIQWNSSGNFAGFTMSGDCTVVTSTGVITCAVPINHLANIAANTYLGNPTSGSAAPVATAIASCSGNNHALQYTTNTGFTCATDITNLDVADQTVTGGANVTSLSQSAGNLTIDCGARPAQYIANTGAWTLTAPANDGYCYLDVENGSGAGAITLVGFSPNAMGGATLDTTNGHNFRLIVSRVHGHSNVSAVALQ